VRARIEWEDERIRREMQRAPDRVDAFLASTITRYAPVSEAYMKTNAPWTDRTGNARQGLHAVPEREKLRYYMVVLAHAVSYGIWLEVKSNGEYEIIDPTMRHIGPLMMQSVSQMFERLFG
jgi:hypothetical protein